MMLYPGKRQVLLFYNNNGIATKEKQLTLLNNEKQGVEERDIEIRTYDVSNAKEAHHWKVPASASFTFILVGKDGGEKLRIDTVVSTTQLFAVIDAMPMRKEEMKSGHK